MKGVFLFVFAVGSVLLAPAAVAQDNAPDLRSIASALAAEQARISELQAELDQRRAVLAALAQELSSAKAPPTSLQILQTAPPVDAKVAVAAPPVTRFEFYGDTKVRYETLTQDYSGCIGCPDRKRGRLRLRFGAEGNLSPDFKAVLGISAGEISDPNTVYVNLGNKFSRKAVTWDRGYVEYHPQAARWLGPVVI